VSVIALTGGTGFVGSRLIDLALADGHQVRALTRRAQPPREGLAWVRGALDTPDALASLATGADAVLHVAGVVNAPDKAGFVAGNVEGTRAVLAAANGRRFVHVSSLAARESELSTYGWSKAEAEKLVTASAAQWDIVRPPGVYGPGDTEMLDMFRLAKRGIALLPPAGRISLIHVDDLVRLLLALALSPAQRLVVEADDGTTGGWTHAEIFGDAMGRAVGRRVKAVSLPRPLLSLAARADRLLRGRDAKLTADRVRYLCHPDWVISPARRPSPALWRPQIATPDGLAQTAQWYRAAGLL
jgi:nucleoside-diphosphate-sugar epimerase